MGRAPCCDKANVKKGPWSPEEDAKLKDFIHKNGTGGNWIALPPKAGLKRCGKSCRLRWLNYLRPNIKHGEFSEEEDRVICALYATIGSRWSIIASQLPGRTDNDIKNYWNTKLKKKLIGTIPAPFHHQHHPTRFPPSLSQLSDANYYISPQFFPTYPFYNYVQNQPDQQHCLVFGGNEANCSLSDGQVVIKQEQDCGGVMLHGCGMGGGVNQDRQLGFDNVEELITVDDFVLNNTRDVHRESEMMGFYY